ncbi:hypothetical protein GTC050_51730 [Burkholderia pseudomallei]|nr:hypothetical protein GTC050_51730 [Burkholderia pseudomallei]BEH33949.1 hypothetical protein GTC054_51650 [Burkholderia pseudomallei]BEH45893.1 hypothetical protein KNG_50940 [Burkholderia pseudomallei]
MRRMKSGVVRRSTCAARLDLRRNCRPYGPVPYGAFDIRKRYALDGATALRDKPGGGEGNRGRALTEQREVDIRALLRGQMHDQLKMSFALWTRHAVRE